MGASLSSSGAAPPGAPLWPAPSARQDAEWARASLAVLTDEVCVCAWQYVEPPPPPRAAAAAAARCFLFLRICAWRWSRRAWLLGVGAALMCGGVIFLSTM